MNSNLDKVKWMAAIVRDSSLTPAAVRIAVELCNQFRIKEGTCNITLAELGHILSLNKRSIQRARDQLRDLEWIKYVEGSWRGQATEYTLLKGGLGATLSEPGPEEKKGGADATLSEVGKGGAGDAKRVVTTPPLKPVDKSGRVVLVTRKGGADATLTPINTVKNCIDNTLVAETKKKKIKFNAEQHRLAERIFQHLQQLNPDHKKPNLEAWSNDIRLIQERDKRSLKEIYDLFLWAHNDEFWQSNILSPSKLRKQWDQLTIKRNQERSNEASRTVGSTGYERMSAAGQAVTFHDTLKRAYARCETKDNPAIQPVSGEVCPEVDQGLSD